MQHIDVIVVVLFAVATVVALLVRKLLVPCTVGLVLSGILLGATRDLSKGVDARLLSLAGAASGDEDL